MLNFVSHTKGRTQTEDFQKTQCKKDMGT